MHEFEACFVLSKGIILIVVGHSVYYIYLFPFQILVTILLSDEISFEKSMQTMKGTLTSLEPAKRKNTVLFSMSL